MRTNFIFLKTKNTHSSRSSLRGRSNDALAARTSLVGNRFTVADLNVAARRPGSLIHTKKSEPNTKSQLSGIESSDVRWSGGKADVGVVAGMS
jgi:hypothetical protein